MTQLLEALKKFYVNQRVPKHGLVYSGAASFFWSFLFSSHRPLFGRLNNASYVTQAVTGGTPPPGYQWLLFILRLGSQTAFTGQ